MNEYLIKMPFVLTVHSYAFLPYYLSQRLTELNVSLFYYLITLIFFKNIQWRQPQVNVKAIKLNFIQQVCLQNFLIEQDNFKNTWHKMKSKVFSTPYNLLAKIN